MKKNARWREDLTERIAPHLEEVRAMFNIPVHITLLVRQPSLADGGVLVSDDDDESIVAEIRRLQQKEGVQS